MSFGSPLKDLFLKHFAKDGATLTPYQRAVRTVIEGKKPDLDFLSKVSVTFEEETKVSFKELIDKWYTLLGGSLLVALSGQNSRILQNGIQRLSRIPFWEEQQILTALKTVTRQLFGLSSEPLQPMVGASGAVVYKNSRQWKEADIPKTRVGSEAALFWCMVGLLQNNEELICAATRVAEWQKNTLDYDGSPLLGLFNPGLESNRCVQITFNYLLFRAVAIATNSSEFTFLAKKQIEHFVSVDQIPFVALLIENWLEQREVKVEDRTYDLPEEIHDLATCLVGVRGKERSVICTLAGGGSGIGTVRKGDAQIISYGPGYLPLGSLEDFGIDAGVNGLHKSQVLTDPDCFAIKRSVRLVSKSLGSSIVSLESSKVPSGIWVDLKQAYENQTLHVDASFYGYESLDSVTFTFFGKAKNCVLSNGQLIQENSLDRYDGRPTPLTLQGERGMVTLIPNKGSLSMQVVPLGGKDCFWEANYLIAFQINPKNADCQWKISL